MNIKITPLETILQLPSDVSSTKSFSARDSERFSVKDQRRMSIFAKITDKLVTEHSIEKKPFLKLKTPFSFSKYPVVFKNVDLREKNLGDYYYFGLNGIMPNLSEAIKIYTIQASDNNHYAQFRLGYCYNYGEGVIKNISQCIRLYLTAAENGQSFAQAHLGELYFKGAEVPRDIPIALSYYNRSECPYAKHCLAICYYNGTGVPKNKYTATLLWYDAAKKGLAEAQYHMGVIYEEGSIVKWNHKKAAYWYSRSAKQGYVPSIERLAHCYTYGFGVRMNKKKALELYKIVNVRVTTEVRKRIYDITSSIDDHSEGM